MTLGADAPGYAPPNFDPASGSTGPVVGPGGSAGPQPPLGAPGFDPPGFVPGPSLPAPTPAPIFVFEFELAAWLADQLGVDVLPNHLPQGDSIYPLLSYSIVDGDSDPLLASMGGISWSNYQFDAWSRLASDVLILERKLYNALAGYTGPVGAGYVRSALPHRRLSDYEDPGDGSDQGFYRLMREYQIWFDDPLPVR